MAGRYLEFKDKNSSKFWSAEVSDTSVNVNYGKIGTDGQKQVKEFVNKAEALKFLEKKVNEKLREGYIEKKVNAKKKLNSNHITLVLSGDGGHVALCKLPKNQYDYACETNSSEVEAMIFGLEVEEDHPEDLELIPWYDAEGDSAFGPEINDALISVYDENNDLIKEIAIIDLLDDKNFNFRKKLSISFDDLGFRYGYLAREVQSGKFASITVPNVNNFEINNLLIDTKEIQGIKIIDGISYKGAQSKDVRISDLGEYQTETKFYEYEMLENNAPKKKIKA